MEAHSMISSFIYRQLKLNRELGRRIMTKIQYSESF